MLSDPNIAYLSRDTAIEHSANAIEAIDCNVTIPASLGIHSCYQSDIR